MGKVYILTNDAMPGYIKIGITDNSIEERMKSLDTTGLPLPFRFYYAIESDRYKEIEYNIHNAFADYRARENREFFKIEPEKAVAALRISGSPEIKLGNEMIDSEGQIVEDEQKTLKTYKKRFSFSFVNIPVGSMLNFTRDNNKKCKVISDNEVEYENKTYSLSKLAHRFLIDMGYNWKTVQGPAFFEFNGKTLLEIKDELEPDDDELNSNS